jgi:dipeptidyl aminopeptidase/acylaminoacyl peptidase
MGQLSQAAQPLQWQGVIHTMKSIPFAPVYLFAWILGISLTGAAAGPRVQEPLSLEDAVSMRSFPLKAPVSLSPDGSWVAYTLQQLSRAPNKTKDFGFFSPSGVTWLAKDGEVWVANTHTDEQFQISPRSSSSWDPAWAPNGRSVAFYSDEGGVARLWVWDLATRRARPLSDLQIRVFGMEEMPRWSPDSESVFTKTVSAGEERPPEPTNPGQARLVLKSEPTTKSPEATIPVGEPDYLNGYRADLTRFDCATGKAERLAVNREIVGWWLSPSGQQLALTELQGFKKGFVGELTYALDIINLSNHTITIIGEQLLLGTDGFGVSWSPEGSNLAFLAKQSADSNAPVECFIAKTDRSTDRVRITRAALLSAGARLRPPVWARNGHTILLMDDKAVYMYRSDVGGQNAISAAEGRKLISFVTSYSHPYISLHDNSGFYVWEQDVATLENEIHHIDLSTNSDSRVSGERIALGFDPVLQTDISANGSTFIYLAQSSEAPMDIWAANDDFSHREKVTTTNPALAKYTFGQTRLLSWRNLDGVELRGALLLPPDFQPGTTYPLIVDVYGGSLLSKYLNVFGLEQDGGPLNKQLLATRGYAVLFPDAPMGDKTPILDLLKDVLPGVNKAVDLGIAKNDFVGVMGESYGGYSALSLLIQTDRFKAAVAIDSLYDLFHIYSSMDETGGSIWIGWAEQGQGRMMGHPWHNRDKYVENSPFFFVDRVNTPVLLFHGAADEVPVEGSREMFVALRRLGKTAEYVEYPEARHMPQIWPHDDQVDFWNRMIEWLDRYLKPR